MKIELREKAIELRLQGYTYSEILKVTPVSRSTLSLWLRSVGLSTRQKQRITELKLQSAKRGALIRKQERIRKTIQIKTIASNEITQLTRKELWILGTALYWAEGSKEKTGANNSGIIFSNSDLFMIRIFLLWLLEFLHIKQENIVFEIYIHESHKNRLEVVKKYWSDHCSFPLSKFDRIYFKKEKIRTVRKNKSTDTYFGLLRVRVRKSTDLNRRIEGWIEGIIYHCGVV